jgi:hypothetical protein
MESEAGTSAHSTPVFIMAPKLYLDASPVSKQIEVLLQQGFNTPVDAQDWLMELIVKFNDIEANISQRAPAWIKSTGLSADTIYTGVMASKDITMGLFRLLLPLASYDLLSVHRFELVDMMKAYSFTPSIYKQASRNRLYSRMSELTLATEAEPKVY